MELAACISKVTGSRAVDRLSVPPLCGPPATAEAAGATARLVEQAARNSESVTKLVTRRRRWNMVYPISNAREAGIGLVDTTSLKTMGVSGARVENVAERVAEQVASDDA